MFTCKIENASGEVLQLTGQEENYQVYQVDGLTPPSAQINMSQLVGLDGSRFNSSKLNARAITIMLKINGDVEANRLKLYNFARTKEKLRVYFTTDSRNVFADGYVESMDAVIFAIKQFAQIGIICPYPYFSAIDEILADSENVSAGFTFPFSIETPVVISEILEGTGIVIYNDSEASAGAVINIRFIDDAQSIRLRNTNTGADFELDYSFLAGDVVMVDTNIGQKSINLIRNGTVTNLFTALVPGSTFPVLNAGANHFEYLVDDADPDGQVEIQFRFRNVYRGI